MQLAQAAAEFLAARRIAVTGVSRTPAGHGANTVYLRLRDRGYDVVPVNPNATEVEGDRCWPDLASVPGGVDAVVVGTRSEHAMDTVRACAELGIAQVWLHRAIGPGSVDAAAVAFGREHGLRVIDGGCPLMFGDASDGIHRFMRPVCTWAGTAPKEVA